MEQEQVRQRAYVSLLFCFIKVFAYDVLEKDTMVRKQGLVASGQRVVDYKVLEKETCKELSDADYQCLLRIVQAEAGCEDMEGKMRSVWQQQQLTSYCLYGSKRNMMLNIFNNSNSPFYRFGQVIFMQKIAKEHWVPFILSSFEKTGKRISESFASRICDVVECHSWYLQQLCYFIWSFTVSEVTEEVFSLGLKQVLNINTPMFQNDTENLSSTQIEMLKAIADGEQHFSSQAVKQVYNLGNPNTIVKNKKILQNKDIIEKQKADFVFVDPVYRLWFKEEYC